MSLALRVGSWFGLAGVPDEPVDVAGADVLALLDAGVGGLQHAAGKLAFWSGAGQDDHVAVRMGGDPEPFLDEGKMGIVFAEQPRQEAVVIEWNHDPPVGRRIGGGRFPAAGTGHRRPAKCCQ